MFFWGLPPSGVALFGVSAAFGGPSAPTIARPKAQGPKPKPSQSTIPLNFTKIYHYANTF